MIIKINVVTLNIQQGANLGTMIFTDSNKVLRRYRSPVDPDIANCIPVSKMFETLNPFETSDLQDYLSNIFDRIIPIGHLACIRWG